MLLWRQSPQPEYSVLIREMDLTFQFNFRRILSYQFKIQPIIFQRSRKILQISDLCSKSKIRQSNFQLTVTTPLRFYEENLENYSCLFSRACIFVFSRIDKNCERLAQQNTSRILHTETCQSLTPL